MTETRKNWTRDELIVALYLYYILPFKNVSARNPTVIKYAAILGRTPAALNMKIGNLGRLDKTLTMQNISGLSNGSKLDKTVWNEFENQWDKLAGEFDRLIQAYESDWQPEKELSVPQETEQIVKVKARINQTFFRSSVLAAYGYQCCITGIDLPSLLIASHIKPWKDDIANRLNPQNGLCLNVLHDKAFDRGLLTLDNDLKIIFSDQLRSTEGFERFFKPYENQMIRLPERLKPDSAFLQYHREKIFTD